MELANSAASSTDSRWRTRLIVGLLLSVWLVLSGRLVMLQFVDSEQLRKLAERQRTIREVVPARPGEIVDREGRVLAATIRVSSLYVVPNRIDDGWEVAQQLADVRAGIARAAGMDPRAPAERLFGALAHASPERAAEAREVDALLARPLRDGDLLRTVRRIDAVLQPRKETA
ncbi:MAG: hypothetical protein AAB284_06655 [Chloroflexota bacterium]